MQSSHRQTSSWLVLQPETLSKASLTFLNSEISATSHHISASSVFSLPISPALPHQKKKRNQKPIPCNSIPLPITIQTAQEKNKKQKNTNLYTPPHPLSTPPSQKPAPRNTPSRPHCRPVRHAAAPPRPQTAHRWPQTSCLISHTATR